MKNLCLYFVRYYKTLRKRRHSPFREKINFFCFDGRHVKRIIQLTMRNIITTTQQVETEE